MSIYDNAGVALIPSGTKASKLYSVLPANGDGDFTHSRGSTATRVNKDGFIESVATNVPRLDYPLIDGVVQDCPALLLEPQRTNLVLQSENFNTTWFNSGTASGTTTTITSNSAIAPDGSQTADLIAMTRPNNTVGTYIAQQQSTGAGVHIGSIYLKAKNAANVGKQFQLWQYQSGERNMITVTLTDYWKRFNTVSDYSLPSGTNELVGFGFRGGVGTDTDVEFYAWGAQGELGTYPTSYIKTTSGQVTRSADVCNGSGTSAEFNDSEGVLFVESAALANDGTSRVIASISNGSITTNRVVLQYTNASGGNEVVAFAQATSYSSVLTRSIADALTNNRFAVTYNDSTNNFDLWANGFLIGDGTFNYSFTSNSLSKIQFADGNSTSNPLYGKVKQLMTFKTALTDSELETLTSWDSFNAMATGQLYTIE